MYVYYSFGLPVNPRCKAGRADLRVHFLRGTPEKLEQIVEVDFARASQFGFAARIHHDLLDAFQVVHGFIDDGLSATVLRAGSPRLPQSQPWPRRR